MLRRFARTGRSIGLVLVLSITGGLAAAAPSRVVSEDRVIAGGPDQSLEVRHLVLRGTNEQIGRALAEIAKQRYDVRAEHSRDPLQVRVQRAFLERNDPILLDRMRGVAAAFGKPLDDDAWDFSGLGYTDLKAGCSIVQLPPSSTASGKSVVSRDYDFTTGSLGYKFLQPGMLHPTARPYLLELHPDRGYASMSMVAYDLLSGVLDGINSEGLTVTLALDATIYDDGTEPTKGPAVGLGELQTLRLLLDTCADVDEAKQALMATKQYYQFVPVHYLIADRHGNAFVWEYSKAHNKEYVIENPGKPLVMTNFTLHTQLDDDGRPPSPEKARPLCKRYAYLTEHLAKGEFDDAALREVHQTCDAQAAQAADTTQPPERTFWNAVYYPEDRRIRVSYYLHDEPYPGEPKFVKPVRTDYLEFRLEPTNGNAAMASAVASTPAPKPSHAAPKRTAAAPRPVVEAAKPAAAARPTTAAPKPMTSVSPAVLQAAIEGAGGTVKRDGSRIVSVSLGDASGIATVLPLLGQLRDVEVLTLGNPAVTDADVRALQGLPKLESLGLMGTSVGDATLAIMKTLPALRELNVVGTKVTDAGLAQLSGLAALEYLGLKGTTVGDAGLANLKGLTGLTNLNLADTKVSDAGLVHLSGMKRLESVNLSNDDVTDAGLEQLARMPTLAGLNVTGTKVTDAGLVHLKALPKLTKLNVTKTAVTADGVKSAKKFLPFWATVTR